MSVHKKIDTSKFKLMYNTYLYDQNRLSIFSVFCTGLKKNELVSRAIQPSPQWRSQHIFTGVAREGPATSLGWHRNLHYFNIKMWLTIKYVRLTILVPKTQLNTINFYLIVIEIFVNYYIK